MKLSTRCRYGARAMMEIARRHDTGPVKRKDIAESQDISERYLENILIALKANKLVRTVRGANGGFALTKAPEAITMYEILSALGGLAAPVDCLDAPALCDRSGCCAAREFWEELRDAQIRTAKSKTLRDLVERERQMQGC